MTAGDNKRQPTAFIDRNVFEEVLQETGSMKVGAYKDTSTIYSDMSRLVVAWLASQEPAKVAALYEELGWGGSANSQAFCRAARTWMQKHHPEKLATASE